MNVMTWRIILSKMLKRKEEQTEKRREKAERSVEGQKQAVFH